MADIRATELLVLQVKIGCRTTDWAFGAQLLRCFTETDARLVPQTLHIWSHKMGDFLTVEDAQPHWATIGQSRVHGAMTEFNVGLTWKRKLTVKYQAEITHEGPNFRGRRRPATLMVYAAAHKGVDWRGFANRIYAVTEAEAGFVHIFRDAHKRADASTAREPTFGQYDFTEHHIPNLGWSTFLGPRLAPFVDRAAVQKAGGLVQDIGQGVAITLSQDVMDVCKNYATFDRIRAAVIATFPDGFVARPER